MDIVKLQLFLQQNWHNLLAVLWFMLCFRGYIYYADRKGRACPSLASMMHLFRYHWLLQAMERENRVADATTVANLERSVAFFASTTLLILAGLMTMLSSTEKAITIVAHLPFSSTSNPGEWELKLLLLIFLFVYAFFKFTWSLRQYGFVSVMVGSAPDAGNPDELDRREALADGAAQMASMAAFNFNTGLRTYYFSMSVLGWFINFWLFMLLAVLVAYILYRREFESPTLNVLLKNAPGRGMKKR